MYVCYYINNMGCWADKDLQCQDHYWAHKPLSLSPETESHNFGCIEGIISLRYVPFSFAS